MGSSPIHFHDRGSLELGLFANAFLLPIPWVLINVGERLKVKCPTCGIQGFIEKRGNSYRVKHYIGYDGNQRKYLIHKLNEDYINSMGINGNQNMGINNLSFAFNPENVVARERFELSSAAPEAAMFDHCTTGLCSDSFNNFVVITLT
jgi:hypothetical protein